MNSALTSPFLMMIIVLTIFLVPVWRIVRRTGHSPWWALLLFVPLGNFIGLWVLAFSRWPALEVRQELSFASPVVEDKKL